MSGPEVRRRHLGQSPRSTNKREAKAESSTVFSATSFFGAPELLPDEDLAAYAQLFARVHAAVQAIDMVDEIFIEDVVALQWKVLRWRRFQVGLVRTCCLRALKDFLYKNLPYDLYRQKIAENLAATLQSKVLAADKDAMRELADRCAQNKPDAVKEVTRLLDAMGLDLKQVRRDMRAEKADELTEEYARNEPDTLNKVNEFLAEAGVSIAALTAEGLRAQFDYIERLDHEASIAERRRNAALREMDRRRAVLGERLRRSVQQIEHDEFAAIEITPAEGKKTE
jgi:hypothetical protein